MTGAQCVLVDGRSGTGKTTLAARLARTLGGTVVHLDDLYPGWSGLRAGSEYATRAVLEPLARGEMPCWRRWNWFEDRRAETHRVTLGPPIVVEGCGALSRANRSLATLGVWLELDEPTRHARAVARDGDDSWWAGWRAEEDAFIASESPASLADVVVDCAASARPGEQTLVERIVDRLRSEAARRSVVASGEPAPVARAR
ncbi:hypothetical protein F8O01_09530 [Pseudoclavibacter chungangensis]|uniref:Uncharacterized protein n=1 Tax=Pseudoclavibacter chungangensis TaxID=587635 RepID=A0A7J5BRN2_9MICO|nr:hypothetical protein [Pseudoclavibacter chungangensis]KAB1656874.1 hypothetical protein F8O01_09530 [Pseudoclavibacter chungangensis]NYJ67341.1 uridine kinase [Pseudoclavibacter chungangensis]